MLETSKRKNLDESKKLAMCFFFGKFHEKRNFEKRSDKKYIFFKCGKTVGKSQAISLKNCPYQEV